MTLGRANYHLVVFSAVSRGCYWLPVINQVPLYKDWWVTPKLVYLKVTRC